MNQSTLTEAERQELLLEKLDLTGLEAWPKEQAEKARSLLREYHDIFSLEKHDTGHTKAAKHKIVLKDPDTPPFKEMIPQNPSASTRRGACSPQEDAGCWSDTTEQQSLVQHCCAGEEERRITLLLHQF